ncbi:transcriptional regulator [Planotetraspora silvatica]|uniref:Transcriptional regulator n=1 Tax=Planotetraspora silvatica TaxID=234614 RepID=A0A8J3XIZ6_9ACTN|nr:transcriptional regulator [Planotetraspora silvatica]
MLFALSDPSRLAIARSLVEGPIEVAACQPAGAEIPKSTLSHHLKTLREAGVVRNVPHGRQRYVSLRREDLDERFPGLLAAVLGSVPQEVDAPGNGLTPSPPLA